MTRVGRCRYCPQEIVWALTDLGKLAPIEAQPVPDGNVVLVESGDETPICWVTTPERPAPAGTLLRLNHFARCPGAARARKRHVAARGDDPHQESHHVENDSAPAE